MKKQSIREFTLQYGNLSEDSYNAFLNLFTPQKIRKNDFIIKEGQKTKEFYILTKGLVRSFVIDSKGKEHTNSLFTPFSFFTSFSSMVFQEPSKYYFECLIDSSVLKANFTDFKELTIKHKDIGLFYIDILELLFKEFDQKTQFYTLYDASKRYEIFKNKNPGLENLVPQYIIASFLSITPVQLSRIRSKK